jgi:hypothetical protein
MFIVNLNGTIAKLCHERESYQQSISIAACLWHEQTCPTRRCSLQPLQGESRPFLDQSLKNKFTVRSQILRQSKTIRGEASIYTRQPSVDSTKCSSTHHRSCESEHIQSQAFPIFSKKLSGSRPTKRPASSRIAWHTYRAK